MRFRAVFASVIAAGALALGGLAPITPAAAKTYVSFDVTKLSANEIVFSGYDCKKTDVRMSYRGN